MSTGPLRRLSVAVSVVVVLGGTAACVTSEREAGSGVPSTTDPVARGCGLGTKLLERIWRGHDATHSEDITTVPRPPNFPGAFSVLGHSGPWDYLQRVPLVLYGRRIAASGAVDRPVTLTDVYPTVAELTDVRLARRGRPLTEAVENVPGTPKLIVTIVWDGAGSNVLDRWPDDHPTLDRLAKRGTSYRNATVGSSPSITPAVHSTLGTGGFPREHGVTAIAYRRNDGGVGGAFEHGDPRLLELTTFADEIDVAFGNRSKAGMVAWKNWHLGMLGHGAALPAGDHDHLALLHKTTRATGNPRFYSTPAYLRRGVPGLDTHLKEVDVADGELDGQWQGSSVREHDNPAWVKYQTDVALTMLAREGYGDDAVPDMLFMNYKMTDIVGHNFSMDSSRMGRVLRAQDHALKRLVDFLDSRVKDYVVVVTADHGHTPSPERTKAWPILSGEMARDIDAHFETSPGSLIEQTSPVGPFLDRETLAAEGVTVSEIARFLNGYTLRENWNQGELPEGYEGRGEERILAAAFPKQDLPEIMRCARESGPG